jgi:transposase
VRYFAAGGNVERFSHGKQIASYLGLVPLEKSSGNRRRLGHITKQGSSMLRFLLVEAAQVTVRSLPEWRSQYFRLMMRRGRNCGFPLRVRLTRTFDSQLFASPCECLRRDQYQSRTQLSKNC